MGQEAGDQNPETPSATKPQISATELAERMTTGMFACRGYDITNLGRTPEMIDHPVYGAIFQKHLKAADQVFHDVLKRDCDLVSQVRLREDTTIATYGKAIALILSTELAQLECLEQHFGIPFHSASCATGYSLGEVAALIAGGVYELPALLTPLLALSDDTVALAQDVSMGILFSRKQALDIEAIQRHCVKITAKGNGTISISTYLSPNSVLLMGKQDTVRDFKKTLKEVSPDRMHLRLNPNNWPPIHTPIVRQRNIPNRASVMMDVAPGGFKEPSIPLFSCITDGAHDYNEFNSRELLIRWVDNPQRLWGVVERILQSDVETVIHVGPTPNIIPATLNRLSNNIISQMADRSISAIGMRAVSSIVRTRSWVAKMLSANAALLRAPFLTQIVLEDWLLENSPHLDSQTENVKSE